MVMRLSPMRGILFATVAPAMMLAGCKDMASADASAGAAETAVALDPILADPQIGDLYASELTAFSAVSFNRAAPGTPEASAKSYGMLKVVEVQPDRVFVITEQSAWDNPNGARNELNSDSHNVTWDESERIPIKRSDFASLVADGKIIDVRRMPSRD